VRIEDKDVGYKKLGLKIACNEPAKISVEFGTTQDLGIQTPQTDYTTNPLVSIDQKLLTPGTTYYYKVVAETKTGKHIETSVGTVRTKGYTVRVTVLDKNRKPLAGKSLELHSDVVTVKTNGQGVAEFTDVAPGNHEVRYGSGKKQVSTPIQVADNLAVTAAGQEIATPQNFSVVLSSVVATRFPLVAALVPLLIVLGLIAAVVIMRRKGGNFPPPCHKANGHFPSSVGGVGGSNASPATVQTPGQSAPVDQSLIDKIGLSAPDPGSVIEPGNGKHPEGS
jgi:hypothetical protein